jgi:membrane protein
LSEKFASSSFAKNVLGPKVVEPLHQWYQNTVAEPDNDTGISVDPKNSTEADVPSKLDSETSISPATSDPTPSADANRATESSPSARPDDLAKAAATSSLASAQAAEAFFAGPDAHVEPAPQPVGAPTQTAATNGTNPKEEEEEEEEPLVAPPSGFAGIKDILMRLKTRVKDHNLNVVAAGVAFWGLLAIPAVLTAVVSIYGLVSTPEEVEQQIEDSLSGASEEMRSLLTDQLSSIASGTGGGLAIGAIVGIVLALWTSSGAVAKVMATLNTIWGVTEDRKFFKLRGTAVAITIGAIVGVGVAAFLLAALPVVLDEAGMGNAARWSLNIGRFPLMLVLMALGLSVLYWVAPNVARKYRVITWGAVWATILWLLLSGAFSVYTANFGSYNETYGAIAGVVVLLLWLFITAFMVLIGAEIDAIKDERNAERTNATAAKGDQA